MLKTLKSLNSTTADTWVINMSTKSSMCHSPPYVPFSILSKLMHAYIHVVQINISTSFAPTNMKKLFMYLLLYLLPFSTTHSRITTPLYMPTLIIIANPLTHYLLSYSPALVSLLVADA